MAFIAQLHDGVAVNKFELTKPKTSIGRSPDNDIFIDDSAVSTQHAVIEMVQNPESESSPDFYIQDLESTNSTHVNGNQVQHHQLYHNDVIRIGFASFKYIDETKVDADQTAKIHKSWIPGVYYTKD